MGAPLCFVRWENGCLDFCRNEFMKSWKTTLGGVATILGAVASAIKFGIAGQYAETVSVLSVGIPAGISLINARDHNVTSEQAGLK